MSDASLTDAPLSEEERTRLEGVRRGLLHLHKALLDSERAAYEQVYGRITSSGELLQLVINDPWFAWLRTISELVVQADEMLEAKDPVATEREGEALLTRIRALLTTPAESGDEFARKYQEALQRDPSSVLAHAAVVKLLGSPPRP